MTGTESGEQVSRKQCVTCQTLERWSFDGIEPGRKAPTIQQTWTPGTRTLDGEEHACEFATCDDCKDETCECDGHICEGCCAHLCPDCTVSTNAGYFCEHCCVSGHSYAAVTELVESNYRLRRALQETVDGYAAGDNPRWLAPALKELAR